jgi:hypothetical protein
MEFLGLKLGTVFFDFFSVLFPEGAVGAGAVACTAITVGAAPTLNLELLPLFFN